MVLASGTKEVTHGQEDNNGENVTVPFGKGVEVFVSQNRHRNPASKGPRSENHAMSNGQPGTGSGMESRTNPPGNKIRMTLDRSRCIIYAGKSTFQWKRDSIHGQYLVCIPVCLHHARLTKLVAFPRVLIRLNDWDKKPNASDGQTWPTLEALEEDLCVYSYCLVARWCR